MKNLYNTYGQNFLGNPKANLKNFENQSIFVEVIINNQRFLLFGTQRIYYTTYICDISQLKFNISWMNHLQTEFDNNFWGYAWCDNKHILLFFKIIYAEKSMIWKRKLWCMNCNTTILLRYMQWHLKMIIMVSWWNTFFMDHWTTSFSTMM